MGSVIRFVRRHARTSATGRDSTTGTRAAHSVIKFAVAPAALARSVIKIGAHHSAGMLSRCHHFETAEAPAPMSAAMLSREDQSSMIERNEVRSDMPSHLGHLVLKRKAILSCDYDSAFGKNTAMPERMSETEEKAAFIRRVKIAREARFPTQTPMLTLLEIEQGTYKQYETRTPLPHRLIPKFCAACGVSLEWLLTGEGQGPKQLEFLEVKPTRARARQKRRAA